MIDEKIKNKLVLALDVEEIEEAKNLVDELSPYIGTFKVGLQLFCGYGLEIVNYIKESNSYQNYLKAKELLNKDEKLKEKFKSIKKYQQEIVKNPNKKKELEKKIQECLDELNKSPLYTEYLGYLEEVNNMLNIFENKLNKYFYDLFN